MHYELYIDVLFFTNFMMDSLLLLAVGKVLGCRVDNRRIFGGAAFGAFSLCVVTVVPLYSFLKYVLLYLALPAGMLFLGLRIRNTVKLFQAFGLFYVTAFLWGGIQLGLRPYIKTAALFFAVSAASYYILAGCWKLLARIRNRQKNLCEVRICTLSGEYTLKALVDTGNALSDPVSKEPVSVIGKETARQILSMEPAKGMRYIPFRSVGGEGLLAVIRVEKMCVYLPEEHWVMHPIIGISGQNIQEQDEYQMILNPDIIGGAKT